MCGIYLTNIPFDEEEVRAKLKSIEYRGPDHMGIELIDNIHLGHLRLSILDLDPRSNQPMKYGNLHLVYNGEIYNYLDVKNELIKKGYTFHTESDTEVLLKGYKEWGNDLLKKINGMFAFSIYNSETRSIFSARDRMGVKPFYYYWNKGEFEICSQIRPLLKGKKINEDAISIYLDCKFIPTPYTIVEKVFKLPPGHYSHIDLDKKTHQIHEYWNLKKVRKRKISYEQAKLELHELLKDSIKIRLQSDVPIGCFLSGGIDSSLIASIASTVSEDTINTFSIGFDDVRYDESKIAEQYSNIIKTKHLTIKCHVKDIMEQIPKLAEVYDEPFADTSALPSLLLNSVTKKKVTVALSGDGGDESFIGYDHFDSLNIHKYVIDIPHLIRKLFANSFFLKLINQNNYRVKNALKTKTRYDFIENVFSRKGLLLKKPFQDWMKYYQGYKIWSKDFLQKAADLNIKLWLENDSNVKVDRASMAYSVEVRSPFLDYRIVEFARSLPIKYRYKKGRKKRILRDLLSEYIPEKVFNQPKRGFSLPLDDWIRTDLKEIFIHALNDDFLNRIPNLNVDRFKKIFHDHLNHKNDHTEHIWKLYVLSLWYNEFEKYNSPPILGQ